jgi:hypothetical protein
MALFRADTDLTLLKALSGGLRSDSHRVGTVALFIISLRRGFAREKPMPLWLYAASKASESDTPSLACESGFIQRSILRREGFLSRT